MPNRIGRRVAIVAGLRTPFVKAGTVFKDLTALDLGKAVVSELVQRAEVNAREIDAMVFGTVIHHVQWSNIAREVALASGLPKSVEAHSVVRACATSLQALTSAADAIALGNSDVAIAGGVESMSDVPINLSRPLAQAMVLASKGKTVLDKLRPFSAVGARDVLPVPPAIAEYSTGQSMGESAEKMAKENGISREAQDAFAHRSHSRATAAWKEGLFNQEVMRVLVPPGFDGAVSEDNTVRRDSQLEGYGKLKPVFDKKFGSITAGNSSPLTDGASALLLMSEEKARSLGHKPLGFLRSYAYAAVDPGWQLLQAPAFSAPKALQRAGMKLADLDLVEIHEAFAAQVLSNLQAWGSKKFAEEHLGGAAPMGEVPDEKLNPHGGSLSLGHPFAATGGRMVVQALRELERRGKQSALLSICAAGGLGAAVVLERE
jgi:acetyl-CoA acyltransferase